MFGLTHRTGFGAGNRGPRVEYVTQATDETNTATYTFSGVNIGTPASDRVVAVGVVSRPVSPGARSISSVTVGGSGTTGANFQDSGNRTVGGIYWLSYPTGSTANIVVTLSGAMDVCGIMVWAAYGALDVALYSIEGNPSLSDPLDTGVVVQKNGGVIVAVAAGDCASWAWTGLTENYDGNLYASGADKMSAASTAVVHGYLSYSITADPADALIAGVLVAATIDIDV